LFISCFCRRTPFHQDWWRRRQIWE
jgi:hypothetical protein